MNHGLLDTTNLLEETMKSLKEMDLTFQDILYAQLGNGYFSVEHFKLLAAKTEYDDGFGLAIIDECLMLVGKDFYLDRREYDGSEWWQVNRMPEKPLIERQPTNLLSAYCQEDDDD